MDGIPGGKKKKIFPILAAVILIGTILVIPAVSEDSDASSINLTKTDWSGIGFSWSYTNHTLELNNFEFRDSETPFIFPDTSPVMIVISGTNTIEVTNLTSAVGINDPGADMILTGSGSLTVKVDGKVSSYGILCDTVDFNAGTHVAIESNSMTTAYGIASNTVIFNEYKDISIKSSCSAGISYGIVADTVKMIDSNISLSSAGIQSCGIEVFGSFSLSNSCVDVVSSTYGVRATGNITLSDSSTLAVDTRDSTSYGITAKNIISNKGLLISDGTEYAFSASESIIASNALVLNANEDCTTDIPSKLTQKDASMSVVITNTEMSLLKMSVSTMKIRVGNSNTLEVTYGSDILKEYGVTWSSAKDSIATVDQNGKVTGCGNGVVTITARSNLDPSQTATCIVTVGTATGREPVDLWIPIVCAIAGCLAILGVALFVNKKLK